ncbi:hypothetical protein CLOP_g18269 [Closterium sp. NIES-67]|nr:hypothetical protein CLOP_g18269 [Closterium sp. NIES-67]
MGEAALRGGGGGRGGLAAGASEASAGGSRDGAACTPESSTRFPPLKQLHTPAYIPLCRTSLHSHTSPKQPSKPRVNAVNVVNGAGRQVL